ncbi:DEAD/DEAH box helicase [Cysteiniphilum halobium]|uniref:DEAD/DEAH box helicase n=1 Tax=Cysteiniphilum halobium TaxID=2219059 RepID=UPI003F849B16
MLNESNLYDYQKHAVDFIIQNPRCGLFLDMGLGKTVSTLTAIDQLLKSQHIRKVLIVAPLRVALQTWPQEFSKWQHLTDQSYTIIHGSADKRKALLNERTAIHIINRDNVCWLIDLLSLDQWPYDMLIIDESSSFKDPTTKRFKALKKVAFKTSRIVLLTGTPTPNGLLGIWSQLYLLDQGKRLGRTYTWFKQCYFMSDMWGYKWTLKPRSQQQITQQLEDVCMSMRAEDYLQLPERINILHNIELTTKARNLYEKFKQDYLLMLEDKVLTAASAAVLMNKLLQFCNGAIYHNDSPAYEVIHHEKLDVLTDIVEANADEPILVAYLYRSDLERIQAKYPEAKVLKDDVRIIDQWNQGKIKMLLAHPASCGHGLNLQHGGCHMVWFGLTWSLELYDQMNARLHRQGQTKPVMIHHIISNNTVEMTVQKALTVKADIQNAILEALKS